MRSLLGLVALGVGAFALSAEAAPYDGCTFYQPQLTAQAMACANFQLLFGACKIKHCSMFGCITYPGALFTGWMPDHFIEVTNRAGESAFTSPDMPAFKLQMVAAAANWMAHGDLQHLSTTSDHARGGHDFSMFFGRSLPVPYGPVGWTIVSLGMTAGTPVPTCFSGITEFAAETWGDWLISGDRLLAAKWAPLTAPVCSIGGAVLGAIAGIPLPSGSPSIPAALPCAAPLTPPMQVAAALTGKSATDPTKQCMGALGALLPRTGYTEGSSYTAAERIAWRTASLAEDYFKTGVGVLGDDKWQIVHPISTGMCFAPGSLLRPSPLNGGEAFARLPAYDSVAFSQHQTEYVFAVWRKRTQCVEPILYPAVKAELASFFPVHSAACKPLNAKKGAGQ